MHFKGGAIGEPMQSRLIALMDLRHCCRTFRLRIGGMRRTRCCTHHQAVFQARTAFGPSWMLLVHT